MKKEVSKMTDHHVHIGQFNEIYYDALEEEYEENCSVF